MGALLRGALGEPLARGAGRSRGALRSRHAIGADRVEVVRGRPRDFVQWLARGWIDLAVAGADDLAEGGWTAGPLWQLGFGNSSLVLLEHASATRAERECFSQFPRLATHLLRMHGGATGAVRPIAGTAEVWVQMAGQASAVDTWQTGRTADANGLRAATWLGATSLACFARPTPQARVAAVADAIRRALATGGTFPTAGACDSTR
jgi:ATP phosphoribosyltransferase